MFDHPNIDVCFCIENDIRKSFVTPNKLNCITTKSYIRNPTPTIFSITSTCPSGFVDVSENKNIYNK